MAIYSTCFLCKIWPRVQRSTYEAFLCMSLAFSSNKVSLKGCKKKKDKRGRFVFVLGGGEGLGQNSLV